MHKIFLSGSLIKKYHEGHSKVGENQPKERLTEKCCGENKALLHP